MSQNVYIHIPFCKQKCNYCSFVSYPNLSYKQQYISCLKEEIKAKYKNEILKTLYFGGGTPSLMTIYELKSILELFNIDETTEITLEINPETVDKEYLKDLKTLGINRLSIGCQTFNDKILKLIGRKHTSKQAIETVDFANQAGFTNISLDFIYGLPNQTEKDFTKDLERAITSDICHISLYGLKIDEGCIFYKNYPANLPDEDAQSVMYRNAINILTANNFEHYEISNFAKKGYESKHNLNYWNNNSYYGFGIAAHGYTNGIRYSNPVTFDEYFKNPIKPFETKKLSEQEKLEEEIFLGLRRMNGIDVGFINNKYNINFEEKYKSLLDKYILSGHLVKTENGYKFSTDGVLVSNYILADFLE